MNIVREASHDRPIYHALSDGRGYSVSFEGRFFLDQGGYKGQAEMMKRSRKKDKRIVKLQKKQEKQILILNILIALGTIVVALDIIIKYF